MNILIIDDLKTYREIISTSLQKMGHTVRVACNGEEAIKLFKQQRPDLIILDVIMQGMDGFECAKSLRSIDSDDWIPIIFLSGAVTDKDIEKGINAGGDDYLAKPFSEITLAAKIKAMQRIADMRHKLLQLTQQLSILSSTDTLTGISNRRQFELVIKEKISQSQRHNLIFALLFIDLDNFKIVNDALGHTVGDLLLKEIAKRLTFCLRIHDFVARMGGDEFAVILSSLDTPEVASFIAQKIIDVFSTPFHIESHVIHTSASIGIACYPENGKDPETIIKNADIAMYQAKASGKNNYHYLSQGKNMEKDRTSKIR